MRKEYLGGELLIPQGLVYTVVSCDVNMFCFFLSIVRGPRNEAWRIVRRRHHHHGGVKGKGELRRTFVDCSRTKGRDLPFQI